MISSRNNHLVVGKRAILVRDIVNSVCDRQTIEFISKRFPVSLIEIWECIDTIADIDSLGRGLHLKVVNNSSDRQDIKIEAVQISDTFFIKVVQFGKIFLPECNDFSKLFDKGFIKLAVEVYDDLSQGMDVFEESELHVVVHKAIDGALGNTLSNEELFSLLQVEDERERT